MRGGPGGCCCGGVGKEDSPGSPGICAGASKEIHKVRAAKNPLSSCEVGRVGVVGKVTLTWRPGPLMTPGLGVVALGKICTQLGLYLTSTRRTRASARWLFLFAIGNVFPRRWRGDARRGYTIYSVLRKQTAWAGDDGTAQMKLRLSQGYYLEKDPDIWTLRRPDGGFVAAFSASGVVAETSEDAAWEDHRRARAATDSVKTPRRDHAPRDRPLSPPRLPG
jgi:hypothetical protein